MPRRLASPRQRTAAAWRLSREPASAGREPAVRWRCAGSRRPPLPLGSRRGVRCRGGRRVSTTPIDSSPGGGAASRPRGPSAAMAHADARRRGRRVSPARSGVAARSFCATCSDNGRGFGRARDLEVVAAAAKVDDARVVSVLEDSHEHAIAQTLRIAAEQLARATANVAGAHGLVARREIVDGATNEIERFGAREALTRGTDAGVRDGTRRRDRRRAAERAELSCRTTGCSGHWRRDDRGGSRPRHGVGSRLLAAHRSRAAHAVRDRVRVRRVRDGRDAVHVPRSDGASAASAGSRAASERTAAVSPPAYAGGRSTSSCPFSSFVTSADRAARLPGRSVRTSICRDSSRRTCCRSPA